MTTNANIQQLNEALDAVNKDFADNIVFKRLEQISSNRARFTLTVKNSREPGGRIGYEGRRVAAVCWHVHGQFFDSLLEINPEAVILAGKKKISAEGGNWQDWNIGSILKPMYCSEACDC
jgi:hypothetical protein